MSSEIAGLPNHPQATGQFAENSTLCEATAFLKQSLKPPIAWLQGFPESETHQCSGGARHPIDTSNIALPWESRYLALRRRRRRLIPIRNSIPVMTGPLGGIYRGFQTLDSGGIYLILAELIVLVLLLL